MGRVWDALGRVMGRVQRIKSPAFTESGTTGRVQPPVCHPLPRPRSCPRGSPLPYSVTLLLTCRAEKSAQFYAGLPSGFSLRPAVLTMHPCNHVTAECG